MTRRPPIPVGSILRGAGRRRTALVGTAAALLVSGMVASVPAASASSGSAASSAALPVGQMEKALQAQGDVSDGVLQVEMTRSDINGVHGGRSQVRFVDGFQLQHDLTFQSIGKNKALFNGDLALEPDEIQPVIDAMLANHLDFQAEHQHLYDLSPMVWFVHFRGTGAPVELARRVHDVITKTGTPLPQTMPSHPTTPLPAEKLGKILGGDATVGENGVVTVLIPRVDRITLAGVPIKPELNVSTNVQFEPLGNGMAAVIPDFSMTAAEITPVMATMRSDGWEVGCLYNQETAEAPQLYFSHMFKTGNPETLARQIRAGLDHTHAQRP